MKHFSISTALLLLTWFSIAAYAASLYFARETKYEGMMHDVTSIMKIGESYIEAHIANESIAASPPWDYSRPNPPITPLEALGLAEKFRNNELRNTPVDEWGLTSIALHPLDGNNAKWCWCILFTSFGDPTRAEAPIQIEVFVTMDGVEHKPVFNDGSFGSPVR